MGSAAAGGFVRFIEHAEIERLHFALRADKHAIGYHMSRLVGGERHFHTVMLLGEKFTHRFAEFFLRRSLPLGLSLMEASG